MTCDKKASYKEIKRLIKAFYIEQLPKINNKKGLMPSVNTFNRNVIPKELW